MKHILQDTDANGNPEVGDDLDCVCLTSSCRFKVSVPFDQTFLLQQIQILTDCAERMKVTVCLNPVHSATGPLGVVLGYDLFAHMLNTNDDMMKMARMIAYDEGLPVVADPGILSPQAFVDELFNDRFPNEYLGDTNLRLAVDVSQMVGIRFGETIKAYVQKFGDASRLTAIPLGIAG